MQQFIGLVILLLAFEIAAAATPWQKVKQPVVGESQTIGGFSNGCIIGAKPLPLKQTHYQVMRSERLRYFGHPDLISFIQRLAKQAERQKLGILLIGDMGMPAGGRFATGHASHQTGLDVDIWLQLPKERWTKQQLKNPQAVDMVTSNGKEVIAKLWQAELTALIKSAATDKQVTRIFVHPAIKQQLCDTAGKKREWLNKVRPWYGHRAHMHVRLRCPIGDKECLDQTPPPLGDGCGKELQSWFEHPPKPVTKKSTPPPEPPPPPVGCQVLLDNQFKVKK